jgi:integrase
MATFRKRSNAWQARVQRNGQADLSKTFKSRSEALAWARGIEYELDKGFNHSAPPKATLGELLNKYLNEVTPNKKGASVETYRIRKWLKHSLAQKAVTGINSSDLCNWRDDSIGRGISPNTIRLELAIVSHLYTVARAEWGFQSLENPTVALRIPKLPKGRTRRVDPKELEYIAYSTESIVLPAIITLAVESAMRRSEIASLRWEHVQLTTSTLLLPHTKNGDSREVPLSSLALKAISLMDRGAEGTVFNMTAHAISIAFSRACKRANVQGLHFHDLRHEAISRLFERGLSLPEVATISGHRTWAMLSRYTHLKAQSLVSKLG